MQRRRISGVTHSNVQKGSYIWKSQESFRKKQEAERKKAEAEEKEKEK